MKGAFVRSSFENVRIKSLIIGDEISLTAKLLPREDVFRPFWLLFVLVLCSPWEPAQQARASFPSAQEVGAQCGW